MQSCTIPDRAVRTIGTALSPITAAAGLFSIISGATSDYSHLFAMSYPRHVNTNEMFPRSAHATRSSAAPVAAWPIHSSGVWSLDPS